MRRELDIVAETSAELTLATLQQLFIRRGDIVLFLRLAQAVAGFTTTTRAVESADQLLRVGFDDTGGRGIRRCLCHLFARRVSLREAGARGAICGSRLDPAPLSCSATLVYRSDS